MELHSIEHRYDTFCSDAQELLDRAGLAAPEQKPKIVGRAILEAFNTLATIHFPDDKEISGIGPRGLIWGMHGAIEGKSKEDQVMGASAIAEVVKYIIKYCPPLDLEREDDSAGLAVARNDEDVWEPLKIDRGSQEYQEAVQALDEAVKQIAGNNGYAESEPEERNHIVESLKSGYQLAKEHMPSRQQIVCSVVQPLSYIARKFADTAMGRLPKLRFQKSWLGCLRL